MVQKRTSITFVLEYFLSLFQKRTTLIVVLVVSTFLSLHLGFPEVIC
jgi:hypothetical protein